MMKNKILFVLFLLGVLHQMKAQHTGSFTTTPEAATVMKNIDFQAVGHTGIVNTTIPLYETGLKDFRLDLSLNYSARGIHVEEVASQVGLGWSLNAGGMITRAVRGEPDDFNKIRDKQYSDGTGRFRRVGRFWTKTAEKIKDFNPANTNFNYIETQLKNISVGPDVNGLSYHGVYDLEPDMFYFSCNGISGQFVFDVRDNGVQTIKLIPYQDVAITHTLDSNGEIHSFTLTDDDGNVYFFNERERIYRQERRVFLFWNNDETGPEAMEDLFDTTYNSAWYLSKITTPAGGVIQFAYENEDYAMVDNVHHYTEPFARNLISSSVGNNFSSTKKRISRITTPHETIKFIPSAVGREDLNSSKNYSIGRIEVTSVVSGFIKSLDFSYSYFVGHKESLYGNSEKRLKLVSLRESGVGTHKFEYSSVALPDRYSKQQDFWGFYNGASGNKDLLPSIWYYSGNKGSERFSIYKLNKTAQWTYTGANRNPDVYYAKAGMLTKIIHPEGGKTEFDYELNTFTYLGATRNGAGLRIKSIKKYDKEHIYPSVLEQYYTYSTGKIITMPVFGYCQGIIPSKKGFVVFSSSLAQPGTTQGGFVGYETVTITEGANTNSYGKTEYRYNVPATYGDASTNYYKASRTYIAGEKSILEGKDLTNITGMNVYPYPPHPNFDWNRGQLLSKKVYDSNNVLKHESVYTYDEIFPLSKTNPDVIYGLKFFSATKFFDYPPYMAYVSRYGIITEVKSVLKSVTERLYESNSTTPITNTTRYTYDKYHTKPVSVKRSASGKPNEFLHTDYLYAMDFSYYIGDETKGLGPLLKKKKNVLIEKMEILEKAGKRYLIGGTLNQYNGSIYPACSWTIKTNTLIQSYTQAKTTPSYGYNWVVFDAKYEREHSYDHYDTYGNYRHTYDYTSRTPTVILWSHRGKYPIAVIKNASFTDVKNALGASLVDGLSVKALPTASDYAKIRSLRAAMPAAEITTYTYKDMVGVTEVNDPKGVSTYYEYDSNGLLHKVYETVDGAKKLTKDYTYQLYPVD